eukprot:TRINITY_DN13489_c0_g1_i1.p1 TRINITY_DN13489_c0_g1~~TRINITY_DN13489_c0_g1_i1.p1  ORF type:complete len:526 (-),score=66.59 TRINITY_DN13489_c0_g1_i1:154-1590(-)
MARLALSAGEAALDIWVDCVPHGYEVDEDVATTTLAPRLVAYFQQADSGSGVAELVNKQQGGQKPVFLQLLRPRHGTVHFVYFWKACCDVARMVGLRTEEGLVSELETLLDSLLRRLEPLPAGHAERCDAQERSGLPLATLVSELYKTGSMSADPAFWRSRAEGVSRMPASCWLQLSDLAGVLLALLHEAAMLENNLQRSLSLASSEKALGCDAGLPVWLHVYDVSKEENVQTLNMILAHEFSPVKFGGVFHAGVEVNGLEWSFGYSPYETKPGVSCVQPGKNTQHNYRQRVYCGMSTVSEEGIARIIAQMLEEYPGPDYDLLRRNCCHFADDFCLRLGVAGIPSWVHRLARVGANVTSMLEAARQVRDSLVGPPGPRRFKRPPPKATGYVPQQHGAHARQQAACYPSAGSPYAARCSGQAPPLFADAVCAPHAAQGLPRSAPGFRHCEAAEDMAGARSHLGIFGTAAHACGEALEGV